MSIVLKIVTIGMGEDIHILKADALEVSTGFISFFIRCLLLNFVHHLVLYFQIITCFLVIADYHSYFWACFHFLTIATCFISFGRCTLPDGAHALTISVFYTIGTTSHAIDAFSRYFHLIHLTPCLSGLFTQGRVIIYCCYAGIALLAIKSTKCY